MTKDADIAVMNSKMKSFEKALEDRNQKWHTLNNNTQKYMEEIRKDLSDKIDKLTNLHHSFREDFLRFANDLDDKYVCKNDFQRTKEDIKKNTNYRYWLAGGLAVLGAIGFTQIILMINLWSKAFQ